MGFLTTTYRRRVLRLGLLAVVIATAFGLAAGPSGFDGVGFDLEHPASALRQSRVLLGLLVGAGLAGAGAALQALLRNPLADPFVIGVSGGAALGGAIPVALGASAFAISVPLGAVGGAAGASMLLAWFLARERTGSTDGTLLAGVALNAFAAAAITVIKTLLPATTAQALLFWLVGTVGYVPTSSLAAVGGVVALGAAILWRLSPELDLLALGELEARRLGVETHRVRLTAYLGASLLVGAVVPVTGLIGFVGLVVPHAIRIVFSPDQRLVLPASFLFGAAAVALFDGTSRLAFTLLSSELPVGALTAMVGAPVFASALARHVRHGGKL